MAIDINYKGNNIASLDGVKTAIIECAGKKMTDDLTIIVTEESGGECSGNHIIEVDELPTENIDTTVLYKVGDSYYQYVEGAFRDVIAVEGGEITSLIELYTQLLGIIPELYQIKTKPTTEEELAEIVVNDFATGVIAIYYIEDEADAFTYDGSDWSALGATGVISDVSEATEDGMYILAGSFWNNYIVPKGSVTITENSTVDVTDKKSVTVEVEPILQSKSVAVNGTVTPDEGYDGLSRVTVNVPQPSGTYNITANGTYDVTNYVSAEISVSTTYMVQSVADLPTDAPIGSIAYVLGGE